MDVSAIITTLDLEIARLQSARAALMALDSVHAPRRGRPKGSTSASRVAPAKKKRSMSPEGRARIAAAQKARWAAKDSPEKQAVPAPAKAVGKKASAKRKQPKAIPGKKTKAS